MLFEQSFEFSIDHIELLLWWFTIDEAGCNAGIFLGEMFSFEVELKLKCLLGNDDEYESVDSFEKRSLLKKPLFDK